jgi:shikimate kinase
MIPNRSRHHQPIFLIGYMGSGKSTLGRAVGNVAEIDFIDLDNYIEGRYHKSIKQIFAEHGEEGFRRIERAMLHEVSDFEDVLVACGGGTPCFFDNMEYMNAHGTTVFLNASIDCLHDRLIKGRSKRPLIMNMTDDELRQFIIKALDARMPHYSKARYTFDSEKLESRRQIGDTVNRFITMFDLTPIKDENQQ